MVKWTRSIVTGVVGVAVHGKFCATGVTVQFANPDSPTQPSKVADVMSKRVAVTVVVNRAAEQFHPVVRLGSVVKPSWVEVSTWSLPPTGLHVAADAIDGAANAHTAIAPPRSTTLRFERCFI
jgi:hypothetical protein